MSRIPPLPSDDRLEQLIRDAFETMPGPQMARLELVESRLVRAARPARKRDLNKLPWWIVLLLAGGFAAAAWWRADRLARPDEITGQDIPELVEGRPADSSSDMPATEMISPQNTAPRENGSNSPIIYQREP